MKKTALKNWEKKTNFTKRLYRIYGLLVRTETCMQNINKMLKVTDHSFASAHAQFGPYFCSCDSASDLQSRNESSDAAETHSPDCLSPQQKEKKIPSCL